jgi:hypothetical protein
LKPLAAPTISITPLIASDSYIGCENYSPVLHISWMCRQGLFPCLETADSLLFPPIVSLEYTRIKWDCVPYWTAVFFENQRLFYLRNKIRNSTQQLYIFNMLRIYLQRSKQRCIFNMRYLQRSQQCLSAVCSVCICNVYSSFMSPICYMQRSQLRLSSLC